MTQIEPIKCKLETCRPLVDNEILRKSHIQEYKIYKLKFFSSNSSKIIQTSCVCSVSCIHSIFAVVTRIFTLKTQKEKTGCSTRNWLFSILSNKLANLSQTKLVLVFVIILGPGSKGLYIYISQRETCAVTKLHRDK